MKKNIDAFEPDDVLEIILEQPEDAAEEFIKIIKERNKYKTALEYISANIMRPISMKDAEYMLQNIEQHCYTAIGRPDERAK